MYVIVAAGRESFTVVRSTWKIVFVCPPGLESMPTCYSGSDVLLECGGSYAGMCNTTSGSCLCNDGWSGHSDVVPLDTTTAYGGRVLACAVHVPTIKVLWALTLVPLLLSFYLLPSSMRTMWVIFRRKRKTDRFQYLYFVGFAVGSPVYSLTLFFLVVLKLTSPDNSGIANVGGHLLPTLLHAMNTFCWVMIGLVRDTVVGSRYFAANCESIVAG